MTAAGVIKSGVQASVGVEGPLDEALDGGGVSDVGWHGESTTAAGDDALGDRGQILLVACGEDNNRAGGGEGAGGGGADATARTRDEGDFAGEDRGRRE